MWSKYIGWTPYQYCENDPVNAKDGNGMAQYYDENGKSLGTDNNDDNKNKYYTNKSGFESAQKTGNWGSIQGCKQFSIKSMQEINKMWRQAGTGLKYGMSNKHELGFIQDQDGNPTEVRIGEDGSPCMQNSINLVDDVNSLLFNNKSPDIIFHAHLIDGLGCIANRSLSNADPKTHQQIDEFLKANNYPGLSNSVMLNANGFLNYFNSTGKVFSISVDNANKVLLSK